MRRGSVFALALAAGLGCQNSGASSSSWRWPWTKSAAPRTAAGRNAEADADAIYGGRDPLLSAAPGARGRSWDDAARSSDSSRLGEPPTAPAAASTRKPSSWFNSAGPSR